MSVIVAEYGSALKVVNTYCLTCLKQWQWPMAMAYAQATAVGLK
jgi:hypothetical protein